jgi:carboxyl-terminal processing protease
MRLGPLGARRSALGVALAALVAMPIRASAQATSAAAEGAPVRKRTMYEDLQMLSGILNQIRVNHPDTIDTHELIMAAIQGMVRAADPHSYVVTAMRLSPEKEKAYRDGKLYPVGITFEYIGEAPVIVETHPGSSAAQADLLPGDELLSIDGKPVLAESAFELDVQLSGAKNSPVRLVVERQRSDGSLVQLERTVKRERLDETTAVPAAFLLDPTTGYVRITTFSNEKVSDDLHDAIVALEKRGMQRLVLDLRGNPGGIVDEAAKVAGEFLPAGTVVYTQAGRKADIADTGRVKRSFWRSERRYPIVLMINSGSASASELVAGALQDHDRALVVGRPSFGKSLLMRGFPLPDGSMAVMVFGHVKTPCGRIIQRQYHGISHRDYYRQARAERDTTGRPSCRTAGGRTVYGGGGIYPDIVFAEPEPAPVWLARVAEEELPLQWIGGHLTASGASYASPEALAAAPRLAPATIADFRAFAAKQGVTIPPGEDADRRLERFLLVRIAAAKWGDAGRYRLSAALDGEIGMAVGGFARAESILR